MRALTLRKCVDSALPKEVLVGKLKKDTSRSHYAEARLPK
jgi:hypothetical protein